MTTLTCPVCGREVTEWTETANAVHCKAAGEWRKHLKANPDSWQWLGTDR